MAVKDSIVGRSAGAGGRRRSPTFPLWRVRQRADLAAHLLISSLVASRSLHDEPAAARSPPWPSAFSVGSDLQKPDDHRRGDRPPGAPRSHPGDDRPEHPVRRGSRQGCRGEEIMSFGARSAGARPVEGDVLWKTGTPTHTTSQFPTGLAKRPPASHPRFAHLPQDRRRRAIYLSLKQKEAAGLRPADPMTMHRCNCRRCTSVVDAGQDSGRQRPQSMQTSGRMTMNTSPWYTPGLMQSTGQTLTQFA